jgi:hypothetical protein
MQVGQKYLLANSSESHLFEIEIKKEFDGKDRTQFLYFENNTLKYVDQKYERKKNTAQTPNALSW